MNTMDKKRNIIQLLESSNDEQLIEEVYELLHLGEEIKTINKEDLPSELQNKIERALEDYRSGNYITHQQMKQKVEQWLTK